MTGSPCHTGQGVLFLLPFSNMKTTFSAVRRRLTSAVFAVGLSGAAAHAATYHLDPATGNMSNPGTSELPWSTLEAVAAAGKTFAPGDVLVLRSGYHGSPVIRGVNEGEVLIRVEDGARATLKNLTIRAARGWRIQGLEISPETAPSFDRVTMVSIASDATAIVVEQCRLYTVSDASAWPATDWDTKACSGISVSGPGNTVRSNHLLNVNFGISVTGISNAVERNVVENFSGDGLRGLGDYGVFQFNTVKNCYDVNANHDDGFQSWSVGPGGVGTGVVKGMVLRGNRILNYEDPNQPFRGTLQGIGCFDGFFEDWVVENNEILTDHWHGITLLGARGCRIVNNTVVDLNTTSPGPPWIRISNHKNGMPSTNNVIRNNLATDYSVTAGAAVMDHNIESTDYARYFRDYAHGDLRLLEGCPAIDAGSSNAAPATDAAGVPRPLDGNGDGEAAWDVGAHEFAHPDVDADADGMSDADETAAGTSPLNAQEVLRLLATPVPSGEVRIAWPSVVGRRYTLVTKLDPGEGEWTEVTVRDEIQGTGALLGATVSSAVDAARFFRVLVRGY